MVTLRGTLERVGDEDWIPVTLTAGQSYSIKTNGAIGAVLITDPTKPTPYSGGDYPGIVAGDKHFTPLTSGVYYIAAGSYYNTGAYTIDIDAVADDYADNINTIGFLPISGFVSGRIEASGDTDYFAMSLVAGQSYSLSYSGLANGHKLETSITDSSGNPLGWIHEFDRGSGEIRDFSPATTGTYYFAVSDNGYETVPYSYSVSLSRYTDDYAGSRATTGRMTVGASTGGLWENDGLDRDWFAIDLTAGHSYLLSIKSAYGSRGQAAVVSGPLGDAIYDRQGLPQTSIYGSPASGSYSSGTHGYFTPVVSGTYYVEAIGGKDYSTPSPDPATYTVLIRDLNTPVVLKTTGSIVVNSSVSGSVASNVDYLAHLDRGQSYIVSSTGASAYIFDPAKNTSDTIISPVSSGDYHIGVVSSGAYTVTLSAYTDDAAGSSATNRVLAPGVTVNGTWEVEGDRDWYAITVQAGHSYATSSTYDNAYFITADNVYLGTAYSAQATGTIYIEVQGSARQVNASNGTKGTYTLQFSEYVDDYGSGPYSAAAISVRSTTHADFNGDGHTDLLFRNTSGAVSTWAIRGNGTSVQQSAFNASVSSTWKIGETFDWNGDARSDILFRNDNGAVAIWSALGSGFNQASYYHAPVDLGWRVAAAGDLNGDSKDDLLWQYTNGSISVWSSTGTGFQEGSYSHASPGAGWMVAGLGDFNGDGKADILWRNTNGAVAMWSNTGQGTSFNESVLISTES